MTMKPIIPGKVVEVKDEVSERADDNARDQIAWAQSRGVAELLDAAASAFQEHGTAEAAMDAVLDAYRARSPGDDIYSVKYSAATLLMAGVMMSASMSVEDEDAALLRRQLLAHGIAVDDEAEGAAEKFRQSVNNLYDARVASWRAFFEETTLARLIEEGEDVALARAEFERNELPEQVESDLAEIYNDAFERAAQRSEAFHRSAQPEEQPTAIDEVVEDEFAEAIQLRREAMLVKRSHDILKHGYLDFIEEEHIEEFEDVIDELLKKQITFETARAEFAEAMAARRRELEAQAAE
jgi:hypothetical protein